MWVALGSLTPSGEWQFIATPLVSRLLRLSYAGDDAWLQKYQPRLYLRLKIGDEGKTEEWEVAWPKSGERELVLLDPILIAPNFLEFRKRRDAKSLFANYLLTIEEYQAEPYLLSGTSAVQPTSPQAQSATDYYFLFP